MVTVLAIADELADVLTAQRVRAIDPDLVVALGDLPWSYLEFFASATDAPVVFVPGNHDPAIESSRRTRNGAYHRDGVLCDAPRPHGCVNADQTVVDVAGLRIAGLGGCVRYNGGPHQYTQRQYVAKARRLVRRAHRLRPQGPVDLLLTHAPPRHLGDEEDDCHVGVEALHGVLGQLEPTFHLHGHIHPHGFPKPDRRSGRTTLRNVIPYTVLEVTPRAVADVPLRSVSAG